MSFEYNGNINNCFDDFNNIINYQSDYNFSLNSDDDKFKKEMNIDFENKKTDYISNNNESVEQEIERETIEINENLIVSSSESLDYYNVDNFVVIDFKKKIINDKGKEINFNISNKINNDIYRIDIENKKEERRDYLIKNLKTIVSNLLHKKINKNKKYKFYKMNSRNFTSNTSYKKNKIWFERPIYELLNEFNDKNKKAIKKIYKSKQDECIEIKNILNSTYEEFINNNYLEINDEYQKNFNKNYKNSIMLSKFNSVISIIELIKE